MIIAVSTRANINKLGPAGKMWQAREYTNVVDRLLLTIANGLDRDQAYAKARSELAEKNMAVAVVDNIKTAIEKTGQPIRKDLTCSTKTYVDLRETLVKKYDGMDETVVQACVYRYIALGQNGQQWALSPMLLGTLPNNTLEGFASPLNNYFKRYYSLYADDKLFGALGNFFESALENNMYINPPFTPPIIENVVARMLRESAINAILVTPQWPDADWYQQLQRSAFEEYKGKFPFIDVGGQPIRIKATIWMRRINIAKWVKEITRYGTK